MNAVLKKNLPWILLIILTFVWGSSFILMKRALQTFSAVELGTLRMVFASGAMLPFALKGFRKIKKKQWYYLALFALLGNVLPAYLFAEAQAHIDSSLAGILNALTPIFVLVVGLLFYHLKVKPLNVVGLLMGLVGAVAIIYSSGTGDMKVHFGYASLIFLATIMYSFNINIVKYKLHDVDPVKISIYGFSLMFVPLVIVLFVFTPITQTLQNEEAVKALIYPAFLGIVCSAGAIMVFNTVIKLTSTIFASLVTYLIPVVALILGILDGETITVWSIVWVVFIIIGVMLANKKV